MIGEDLFSESNMYKWNLVAPVFFISHILQPCDQLKVNFLIKHSSASDYCQDHRHACSTVGLSNKSLIEYNLTVDNSDFVLVAFAFILASWRKKEVYFTSNNRIKHNYANIFEDVEINQQIKLSNYKQ